MTSSPAKRPSALDLANILHEAVFRGDFTIGSWLRQETLAAQFDVSRAPIRDALRILDERRIVRLIPNRGARVLGPAVKETADAYLIRAELESLAAERAASVMDEPALEALAACVANQKSETPAARARPLEGGEVGFAVTPWHSADIEFHRTIVRASGLAHITDIVEGLHRFWPCHLAWGVSHGTGRLDEVVAEHERILESLRNRDGRAARALVEHHHLRNRELITEWMQRIYEELGADSLTGPVESANR